MKKLITSALILISLISFGQNTSVDDLWKAYNSHDFQSVLEKAKPLLEKDSNNIDLNLVVGRSYADLGNFKDAVPLLDFTVKNDNQNSWRKAWALSYLGACYFTLQNYDDSEKSLNECIKLNATRNATNDAYGKSLLFGFAPFYKNWKIVETDHFRFHFQNMSDADIEKYTSVREAAFVEINGFFKSTLPKKIDFYVWDSREDAQKILRRNLGFSDPYFCIVHTHFQQTIGHEMTHVISNFTTDISAKTRFVNEGTAVCFNLSHHDKLKEIKAWIAANGKQISIKDFWENGSNYPEEIVYPLAGAFVKELIDHFGRDKFIEACQQAGFNPQVAFESNDRETILGLVTAGVGVTLLPRLIAEHTRADGPVTIENIQPSLLREVGVVWNPQRYMPQAAQHLMNLMGELAQHSVFSYGAEAS